MSVTVAIDPYTSAKDIPHAEVWTPARPLLSNTLPIPATDSGSLSRLAVTAQRRRETSAMRQMWKSRQRGNHAYSSALGQYKKMLNFREDNLEVWNKSPTSDIDRSNQIRSPVRNNQDKRSSKAAKDYEDQFLQEPQPLVRASTDMQRQNKTSQSDKRVSSYSIDYAQVLGVTALPKIPIQTLSADWMTEVKKRPLTRMSYTEAMHVETDQKKIRRQIKGKFFVKNASQTYFQRTIPRHLHTYNIHPEFDSEYQRCWSVATATSAATSTR